MGISGYPTELTTRPLEGCAADAADMALLFLETFEFDQVTLITHGDFDIDLLRPYQKNSSKQILHYNPEEVPTRTTLLEKLTELAKGEPGSTEDIVVFYFSGHGHREGHTEDIRSSSVETILTLTGDDGRSVVVDSELRQKLRQIEESRNTHNVVAIMDNCRSGSIFHGGMEEDTSRDVTLLQKEKAFAEEQKLALSEDSTKEVGCIIMTACREAQQAKEVEIPGLYSKRGQFTYSLSKLLRLNGSSQRSYMVIHQLLKADKAFSEQTPTIMGPQLGRKIFSGEEVVQDHCHYVKGVEIVGGLMNGIEKESTWAIRDVRNRGTAEPTRDVTSTFE